MTIRYENLFKYRSVWMGFAILWVVLYHSAINLSWVNYWKVFGYGGVDIFFFASGLGCYYSLSKHSDPCVFTAKRIKRIIPSYYPILIFWLLIQILLRHETIPLIEIVSNFLCTGVFIFSGVNHQFNWYVSGVWLSYLLAPLFVAFVNRSTWFRRIMLFLFLLLGSFMFLSCSYNLRLTITRLPIFYLGILFAKAAQEQLYIPIRFILLWNLLSLSGAVLLVLTYQHYHDALLSYGLYWYLFVPVVPGLCLTLSLVCILFERFFPFPVSLLTLIGRCSFELYLIHITIFDILFYLIDNAIYLPNNTFWCVTILDCCILAILFRKSVMFLLSLYTKYTAIPY